MRMIPVAGLELKMCACISRAACCWRRRGHTEPDRRARLACAPLLQPEAALCCHWKIARKFAAAAALHARPDSCAPARRPRQRAHSKFCHLQTFPKQVCLSARAPPTRVRRPARYSLLMVVALQKAVAFEVACFAKHSTDSRPSSSRFEPT